MFGAIGSLLAPEVSLLHDLQHHWEQFLDYYASKTVKDLKAEPVEKTFLTFHLNKILSIIVKEEDKSVGESLSPCLEHVLHQDILNILVTLCQADTPPGIRPFIFKFFIFLLDKIKYPLLCETACHLPISRLTLVCSINKASPSESQEIEFLSLLTNKVIKYPHLVQVFIPSKGSDMKSNLSRRSSKCGSQINLAQIESLALNVKQDLETVETGHYLGTALLNYIDSSDYCVACTALQNIIKLAGIMSDESAESIVYQSCFISVIQSRLMLLFKGIPENIDESRMEELEVNWINAHTLYTPENGQDSFHGKTELISFLSFLDFIDNLVSSGHVVIGQEISRHIGQLLVTTICDIILSSDKHKSLLGLSYLGVMWNHIKSTLLRDHFVLSLFDTSDPELCNDGESYFDQILCLWEDEESYEIKIESMRIIDAMLCSPHQLFIQNLITKYIDDRGYYNTCLTESEANSWSDVEDERSRSRSKEDDRPARAQSIQLEKREENYTDKMFSKTFAPSNIHRIVNQWLYLVDDQLRLDEFRGSGYDVYIKDAGRQVESVLEKCAKFSWEKEVASVQQCSNEDSSSYDSRCEADSGQTFYPGKFLHLLFKHIENMLDQNYELNLQLTSLFSTLSQLPHAYLHEYILNTTVSLHPSVNSLYTILKRLVDAATVLCSEIQHFPRKLVQARRALLHSGVASGGSEEAGQEAEAQLLRGVVVLDEFCKELAAIALVKYHIFSGVKE